MIIGMMVENGLRDDGHEVTATSRGKEALECFAPGAFDLVIVDLGIPDKPGDELARAFKAQDPNVAAVLVTGWNLKEDDPRRAAVRIEIDPVSEFVDPLPQSGQSRREDLNSGC